VDCIGVLGVTDRRHGIDKTFESTVFCHGLAKMRETKDHGSEVGEGDAEGESGGDIEGGAIVQIWPEDLDGSRDTG
jgi:hypothetical protein